jgi:uncharacterized membrane protein YdjX (TVP38/TMEM64 family)
MTFKQWLVSSVTCIAVANVVLSYLFNQHAQQDAEGGYIILALRVIFSLVIMIAYLLMGLAWDDNERLQKRRIERIRKEYQRRVDNGIYEI